jgi:hypothetical protein
MASATSQTDFRRNEQVVALKDLPGIPAGTRGKVELVDGLTWTRYRVAFDNGVDRGTIDGSYLTRPGDFERRHAELEQEQSKAAEVAEATGDGEGDAVVDAGDSKVVNGVAVPPHLIERSRSARQRLGG